MSRPLTDEEIIALYFARDERAVTETARRYGDLCMRTARRMLDDRLDAEECVNDTYLKAWNAIPPQKPRVLGAFLCRILRNLAIDRIRARQRRGWGQNITVALEELEECIPLPDDEADRLTALLNEFLNGLEEVDCALFMGRYWHAYSVRELAKGHGLTPNAVSIRLHKTREKLRAYLNERGHHL